MEEIIISLIVTTLDIKFRLFYVFLTFSITQFLDQEFTWLIHRIKSLIIMSFLNLVNVEDKNYARNHGAL